MYCAKCGRKKKETGMFCPDCLLEMEDYPVKPGTPIQLPPRNTSPQTKKRKRKPIVKPEDKIRQLRKALKWMTIALLVTLAAFMIMAFLAFRLMQ